MPKPSKSQKQEKVESGNKSQSLSKTSLSDTDSVTLGDEIIGSNIGARTLLEDSPVCTKIIDIKSKLVFMSHAGISRLGIPDVNVLYGQTYPADLYPEWIRRPMVEHLNRAQKGESCSVECPLLDNDGVEVWYHTTFLPVCDDDGIIQYILATSVEITQRRKAEEDLKSLNNDLERIVQSKTKELRSRIKDLETFTRIAVARELKMKSAEEKVTQLEKEVQRLRDQIKD